MFKFKLGKKKEIEDLEKKGEELRDIIKNLREKNDSADKKKRVVILADWENVQRALEKDGDIRLEGLGKFIRKVAGDKSRHIISFVIFVPDYLGDESRRWVNHNYSTIELIAPVTVRSCSPNYVRKDGRFKDVDSVDWKIVSTGMWYIDEVGLVDEIIVVSHDFDFSHLRDYAEMRGIKYRPAFLSKAFANDYENAYGGLEDAIILTNGNGGTEN
ncbi:hypothetical protein KJ751_01540 [Patescibacteria group bacterium]|nr:hypothetical protein [Patescibacteria group bacterium]